MGQLPNPVALMLAHKGSIQKLMPQDLATDPLGRFTGPNRLIEC